MGIQIQNSSNTVIFTSISEILLRYITKLQQLLYFAFWNVPELVSLLKQNAVGALHVTILKQTWTAGEILQLKLSAGIKKVHGRQQIQDFSTILFYYTTVK